MTHLHPLALAVVLPCVAVAAPAPKEAPVTPITAENASQVRPAREVPKAANRIVRGPDRGALILFDRKDAAEVVDDRTLKPLRPLLKDRVPTDVAVTRDGKLLAWTERNRKSYTVQPVDGGKAVEIDIGDHAGDAAFSPDGKVLAIGYTFWDLANAGNGHSEVRLYDPTGKLLKTLDKTGPGGLRPVFSPDGKVLAVGNRNHETQLFEVATGKLLHKLDKRMTQEIAFSPDGKTLACGYVDGTLGLWEVATGRQLHMTGAGCKEVYSVDWSPKGDVLATSGLSGKIVLWEPTRLTKLAELDAPVWVIQVRFTADGGRLLSSGSGDHGARTERKIVVWSVRGE
jgi:WD40 repeat protein